MSAFDEILWLLKDEEWHDLGKIIEKFSSPKFKLKMAVSFLWEYDFIQVNEKGKKARVRPRIRKFIDEIQRVEKKEASGHKGFEGAVGIDEFEPLRRGFKKT